MAKSHRVSQKAKRSKRVTTFRNKPRQRSVPRPPDGKREKDNFIAEWREVRNLPRPTISRLESGSLPYRKFLLEKVAAALNVKPCVLLGYNPREQHDVVAVWGAIPEHKKSQALETLISFTGLAMSRRAKKPRSETV